MAKQWARMFEEATRPGVCITMTSKPGRVRKGPAVASPHHGSWRRQQPHCVQANSPQRCAHVTIVSPLTRGRRGKGWRPCPGLCHAGPHSGGAGLKLATAGAKYIRASSSASRLSRTCTPRSCRYITVLFRVPTAWAWEARSRCRPPLARTSVRHQPR